MRHVYEIEYTCQYRAKGKPRIKCNGTIHTIANGNPDHAVRKAKRLVLSQSFIDDSDQDKEKHAHYKAEKFFYTSVKQLVELDTPND